MTTPAPDLPRHITETWSEACARCPVLPRLSRLSHMAVVCTAVDTLPGYDLMQVFPPNNHGRMDIPSFLYRRIDPAPHVAPPLF